MGVAIDRVGCGGDRELGARLAVIGWSVVGGVVGGEWEEPGGGGRDEGELCFTPPPLLEGGGAAPLVGAVGAARVGVVLGLEREREEVFAW